MNKFESIYWGMVAEVASCRRESWDLAPQETVASFKIRLLNKYPDLIELASIKFAVNDEYATDNHKISNGEEVNVIPPVSGG
jgi:molybdopterin synthase sulfur carrier subunit